MNEIWIALSFSSLGIGVFFLNCWTDYGYHKRWHGASIIPVVGGFLIAIPFWAVYQSIWTLLLVFLDYMWLSTLYLWVKGLLFSSKTPKTPDPS